MSVMTSYAIKLLVRLGSIFRSGTFNLGMALRAHILIGNQLALPKTMALRAEHILHFWEKCFFSSMAVFA